MAFWLLGEYSRPAKMAYAMVLERRDLREVLSARDALGWRKMRGIYELRRVVSAARCTPAMRRKGFARLKRGNMLCVDALKYAVAVARLAGIFAIVALNVPLHWLAPHCGDGRGFRLARSVRRPRNPPRVSNSLMSVRA